MVESFFKWLGFTLIKTSDYISLVYRVEESSSKRDKQFERLYACYEDYGYKDQFIKKLKQENEQLRVLLGRLTETNTEKEVIRRVTQNNFTKT